MNLVERFVLKIHHVSENAFGYTLIADIDDYGRVEKEKIIRVSRKDYEMIKKKGYYLWQALKKCVVVILLKSLP